MNKKPQKPALNYNHPLTKDLIGIELFLQPKSSSLIRKVYKYICRKFSRYPKWHSVCINDVDGKTQVFLDGNPYLFYGRKLNWRERRTIKKHPFIMLNKEQALKGGKRDENSQ